MDKNYHEDADIRINNVECRVAVIKDNQLLVMFRRKKGEEYYVFPGGHMRQEEAPLETAKRELYEETAVNAKDWELAYEFINHTKSKIHKEYFYIAKWDSGEPKLNGEEIIRNTEEIFFDPMWVNLSDIKDLVLYPSAAKEIVEYYLEKNA